MISKILFFILISLPVIVMAQIDGHLQKGIDAFNLGDYHQAKEYLLPVIQDSSHIHYTPAQYYFGKSLIGIFVGVSMSGSREEAAASIHAPVQAYEAFYRARKTDDGTWGSRIDQAMEDIFPALLQGGVMALENELYNMALPFLVAAAEIQPDNYMAIELRGRANYHLEFYSAALRDFKKATELYRSHPPEVPDMQITFVYFRQAILFRYEFQDYHSAMVALNTGLSFLEREWKRARTHSSVSDPAIDREYEEFKKKFESFKRNTLVRYRGGKKEDGVKHFEMALKEQPQDHTLVMSYASFLESFNREEAIEMYLRAIAIDSTRTNAHYNIGAIYLDKGVKLTGKLHEDLTPLDIEKIVNSAFQNYKTALEWMEKGLSINPDDRTLQSASMQIREFLEKD